ncbi:E2 ubiquitin-protein ligase peroxin 4 [Hypoxylon texense]
MATAFAAALPTEAATIGGVNDLPTHQLCVPGLQDDDTNQSDASSPQPSPRINVPPPNPPFVFPSRPSSSSAPSSFSRSTGRRPQSAIELQSRTLDLGGETVTRSSRSPALPDFSFNPGVNLSPDTASRPTRSPALPDFSFNPGATLAPDESLLSPPLSPQSPRIIPSRTGHRRGGSEFVGGKLKAGESISVMSTSPTRSEGGFASPKMSPTEGHTRRGHAHRRSGAISSHDLTMILKPNNSPTLRGNSAPSSPADFGDKYRNFPEPNIEPPKIEPTPQQTKEEEIQETSTQPTSQPSSPPKPTARTRVGFSDTLEFIPRPLSLVSTDTSSTLTGSFEEPADPSPSKTPKRWSFFSLEPFITAGSPTRTRPVSSSSSEAQDKNSESTTPSGEAEHERNLVAGASQSGDVKTTGRKKKQKKVRSWAGSILTRKSKSRSQKSKSKRRRSQTPPLQQALMTESTSDHLFEAPITPMVMITGPTQPQAELATPEPGQEPEDDFPYPMIDLDAALGPFNTPLTRDPQWEEAQRAGAAPKRQLHSAAGLRGFSGPGMHYHRRAESAPEMPPFEAARFGIHRFGSSSTMADVFEEDEEEDERGSAKTSSDASNSDGADGSADDSSSSSSDDDAASTPTQEHEPSKAGSSDTQQTAASVKRKGSGSSLEMQRPGSRMRTENGTSGLREEVIIEEPSYVASGHHFVFPVTSEAPDSGMPSPRTIVDSEVDPLEVNGATTPAATVAPTTPYSMSYSPSFPSPRSPMSYDAHRISTTPSSVTDENNYHSLLMGEPGPELVRISVDVPSLTSSNSTMTRESSFIPGVRPRNMPFHDQRPASFTSTAFGRRRSSLVSLSRLISTAHGGERSKLSMEVPCDTEPEKKAKMSKSKRLSRMMQFWKPKGSTES